MSLIKCRYCSERVPPTRQLLHLKHCSGYRKQVKLGNAVGVNALVEKSDAGLSVENEPVQPEAKTNKSKKDSKKAKK